MIRLAHVHTNITRTQSCYTVPHTHIYLLDLIRSFLEKCQLCKETTQNKYTKRMTT